MGLKIEDYAMIGDCQTAALVGRDGSIDWLCWPRFDSSSMFARILGDEENGRWLLAAADKDAKVTRKYRDRTLILESRWESAEGCAEVIDLMPDARPYCYLVRIVRGLRGKMRFHAELRMRPNYGVAIPWIRRDKDGSLRAVVGPDAMIMRTNIDLQPDMRRHSAEFVVEAGQSVDFVLGYHLSFQEPPPPVDAHKLLEITSDRWHGFTGHFGRETDYLDLVMHSLITLRALIYEPSGAIVAASATGTTASAGCATRPSRCSR
jgi:GH15 family glucan-1,4-alpha-glucosidase